MSFLKVVRLVCDECCDASYAFPGSSCAEAYAEAHRAGWRRHRHPSGDRWQPAIHVCPRCEEYGRPYKGLGPFGIQMGVAS